MKIIGIQNLNKQTEWGKIEIQEKKLYTFLKINNKLKIWKEKEEIPSTIFMKKQKNKSSK